MEPLVHNRVDVNPEALPIEHRRAREERNRRLGPNELPLTERRQLPDRNTVTSDDERLAAVERPHDLAALVAKLSLADLSRHIAYCSTRATASSIERAATAQRVEP